MRCDQCQMATINGMPCHEHGCPNRRSRWDAESETWIKQRTCSTCGERVDADDLCCSADVDDEPMAWHYALVYDVTPNRATVSRLLDSEEEAIAERAAYGRSDVAAVRSLRPLRAGERIWIGAQARGVEVL